MMKTVIQLLLILTLSLIVFFQGVDIKSNSESIAESRKELMQRTDYLLYQNYRLSEQIIKLEKKKPVLSPWPPNLRKSKG